MRLRIIIPFVAVSLLVICSSNSVRATPPSPTLPSALDLHANVGDLRTSGTSLADVIDLLRVSTSQNIAVNWGELKACRITRELPVTLDLSKLPLDQAIGKLLDHVGGPYVRLGFAVDDNVVVISTAASFAKNTLTRVYDIHGGIRDGALREQDVQAIMRRVRGIDPLSWKEAGGAVGDLRELSGQLIVTQSPETQHLIAIELRDVLPDEQRSK